MLPNDETMVISIERTKNTTHRLITFCVRQVPRRVDGQMMISDDTATSVSHGLHVGEGIVAVAERHVIDGNDTRMLANLLSQVSRDIAGVACRTSVSNSRDNHETSRRLITACVSCSTSDRSAASSAAAGLPPRFT